MKNIRLFLFVGVLFLSGTEIQAQGRNPSLSYSKSMLNSPDWSFRENKGQLMDENHKQLSDIIYYGQQGGVNVYCKPGTLSFVFTKTESILPRSRSFKGKIGFPSKTPNKRQLTTPINRADMVLLNANINAEITATEQLEYYENYYTTGDANHGITSVHAFKTITYQNIYPHIDLVLHSRKNGLEYSFLVHPAGDVDDIQMQWKGMDSIEILANGGIKYTHSLGSMTETAPISITNESAIESRFLQKENTISFKVNPYDKTKDLLIDPTLSWGSYFGGSSDDYAYGIAADTNNNVYIVGETQSTSGIATSGAYQTSYVGFNDAFVAKFTSSGSLAWATYYGSNYGGNPEAITIDKKNNIYIAGNTSSISGIATSGAYQTSNNGNEVFLAKFTSSGSRVWGTYFGGEYTQAFAITADANSNTYITGSTFDSTGIATIGAYQTSLGGGSSLGDAFIAKFDSSGSSLLWGTYFGGYNDEWGLGITHDINNNVYITGSTVSTSGIATSGAYQTSYGGGSYGWDSAGYGDAFVAKFDTSGSLFWGTYFGGDSSDAGFGITADANNNIYITGWTFSDNNIVTSQAYQTSLAGNQDVFVAKFTSSGSLKWGTYYGGDNGNEGLGITADISNNIYVTGWTYSDSGLATKGAYQTSIGGGNDAFIAKFDPLGALAWGTYYRGSNDDIGSGITADLSNNIYITGGTNSTNSIATSGAYQTSFAGNGDAFIAKFSPNYNNDAGLPFIQSPISNICTGLHDIYVQLKDYGNDTLKSVKIKWKINSVPQTTYNWTGNIKTDSSAIINIGSYNFAAGKDTIVAWTSAPNGVTDSVPGNDTAKIITNVFPFPKANTGSSRSICFGNTASIGDTILSGNTYFWDSKPAGFASTSSNPQINPAITTTYYLKVTNMAYCTDSDSVVITVNPLPIVNVGNNQTICSGDSATIGDTMINGNTYSWASNPLGFTSTLSNSSISPNATTTYTLKETIRATGCTKSDSVIIMVNPLPPTPTITQSGDTFTSSARTGNQWLRDSALITGATNRQYVATASGNYSVIVTDSDGCSATSASVNYTLTGISQTANNLLINIYPNPFTAQTTIEATLNENTPVSIAIYDMTGRVVVEKSGERGAGERFEYTFDADRYGCGSGVYFVKLMIGDEVVTREIVKIGVGF